MAFGFEHAFFFVLLTVVACAFFLGTNLGDNPQRKAVLHLILIQGFGVLSVILSAFWKGKDFLLHRIWSPEMIIVSNFYASLVCAFLPLTFLQPGKVHIRKALLVFIPYFAWTLIYLVIISMQDRITQCEEFHDILRHINHFDVWGRLVFFLIPPIATIYAIVWYIRSFVRYRRYLAINFPSPDQGHLLRLQTATFIPVIMYTGFLCQIFHHNVWSSIVFALCFSAGIFLSAVIAYHTETYIRNETDFDDFSSEGEILKRTNTSGYSKERHKIESWLLTEKPYLMPSFQQLDVMDRFGYGRNKVSKIFNLEFKQSFSEYVNQLRIQEAIAIMQANPELSLKHIAYSVGYNSPETFCRSFVKLVGEAPSDFRNNHL